MSHACSAVEMNSMFGSAVFMRSTSSPAVHVLSPVSHRYLMMNGHLIPVGERLRMIIGNDPIGCDVLLLGSRISPRHAEILFHNGCYFVRDLGSVHGTYVNGRRITGVAELHVGDEIQIKPYRMTFTTSRRI